MDESHVALIHLDFQPVVARSSTVNSGMPGEASVPASAFFSRHDSGKRRANARVFERSSRLRERGVRLRLSGPRHVPPRFGRL